MKTKLTSLLTCVFLLMSTSASAAVQIMTTRVIINAQQNEKSVRINNTGEGPALLQLWLDSGKDSINAEKEDLPFVISPPVARISKAKGKTFRIHALDDVAKKLPQDRESVLWLNVLDIPPEDEAKASNNKLNIAFRNRIKLFYRPAGLAGTPMSAAEKLTWTVQKSGTGYRVVCRNNSPFSVNFNDVGLKSGDRIISSTTAEGMTGGLVLPYSEAVFPVKTGALATPTVAYTYITDLGAFVNKVVASQ